MAGGDGEVPAEISDAEFRATFSLLPQLLKLYNCLASGQADSQTVQKAVSELQGQLLRCHRLLEGCPALNHTPEQQAALLGRKREELKQKRKLLLKYKNLPILSSPLTQR